MAKITLSVPDDLYEKIERHKDQLNLSDIFRIAISPSIETLERNEQRFAKDFSWRTIRYNNQTVTVNARLGESGPTDWSLEIKSDNLEKPQVIELGGMPWLDRTIRGVADYFFHAALRKQGLDLSKIVSKNMLSELWLEISKWARRNHLDISTEVALLPSENIRVHGRHGQSEFFDEVTPKDWGQVQKDEDQINVFHSNLWIGSYAYMQGAVFRLSSYLTREYEPGRAKAATRYIDFNPDDPSDEAEIRKLIAKATVVYLPELSIRNVRSIFFEKT